jgi:hypothetical protein
MLLFVFSSFSCGNNTKNIETLNKEKTDTGIVMEKITEIDAEYKSLRSIIFLEEININISSGTNWLVGWENKNSHSIIFAIYNIVNDIIIKYKTDIYLNSLDSKRNSKFDIMKDIPGKRILDMYAAFGDYNNDGYDEILAFGFGGIGISGMFYLAGYDPQEDRIIKYFEAPFRIKDEETGPAPVRFLTYKGKSGFQILFDRGPYALEDDYGFEYWDNDTKKLMSWDENERYVPQE